MKICLTPIKNISNLYVAVYPVSYMKNGLDTRDLLSVYELSMFDEGYLLDDIVRKILLQCSNIDRYGERCYIEIILYRDNKCILHKNEVVFINPDKEKIKYNIEYSDISIPGDSIDDYKCIDYVKQIQQKNYKIVDITHI